MRRVTPRAGSGREPRRPEQRIRAQAREQTPLRRQRRFGENRRWRRETVAVTPKRRRAAAAAGKTAAAACLVARAAIRQGPRGRGEFYRVGDGSCGDFRVGLHSVCPGEAQFCLTMIVPRLAIDMPIRRERDQKGRERNTGKSEQGGANHQTILHLSMNQNLSRKNESESRRASIIDAHSARPLRGVRLGSCRRSIGAQQSQGVGRHQHPSRSH